MREIDPHLPINRTAANVVSKSHEKGFTWRASDVISSMSPLPMKSWIGKREDDLTGLKCGRFTVVGYAAWRSKNKNKSNKARWVVRCSCGRYQMLSTGAVKKRKDDETMMCVECNETRKARIFKIQPPQR